MISAIFGLVGVLIGGLLTAAANFRLADRNARSAGRAAARLMSTEISIARVAVSMARSEGRWMGDPAEDFAIPAWAEHRAVLASAPGFAGWYQLAGAIENLNGVRSFGQRTNAFAGGPVNANPKLLALAELACEVAEEALDAYSQTPPYDSPKVREMQRFLDDHNTTPEPEPTEAAWKPLRP